MALRVLSLMVQTVIEGFTIGGWRHVGQFQLRNDTLIPVVSWTKLIIFVKGERDADSEDNSGGNSVGRSKAFAIANIRFCNEYCDYNS